MNLLRRFRFKGYRFRIRGSGFRVQGSGVDANLEVLILEPFNREPLILNCIKFKII
jgi:hypothetical protein